MALLTIERRKAIFKVLGLGAYNTENIKKLQKKYMARKSDVDGIYGQATDNLLRHLYNCHKYLNKDNFKPEEFKCECNGRYCSGYPTYMKPAQLTNLQTIRNKYKKPMTITSGMRCKGYNNAIGGSIANSKHLLGQATDFYMQGVTDTLANRKSFIRYAKNLPNTTYIYGNGINSYGNSIYAPYMGNAIHYDTQNGNPTEQEEVKGTATLVVDGIGGKETVKRMQEFFGVAQDGIITGQSKAQSKRYPSLVAVQYGEGGSATVKALQKWLGGKTCNGVIGEKTVKAWQRKLNSLGYPVGAVTGIFDKNSMKAWQECLNNGGKKKPAPKPTPTPTPTPSKKGYTGKYPDINRKKMLIDKAVALAWAKGTPRSKYAWKGGTSTPAFKVALNRVYPNRNSWGKAAKVGCSCDVFAGTCIRDCGLDANFPRGLEQQFKYIPKDCTRAVYKNVKPIDKSQDGDIVLFDYAGNGAHIVIRGNGYYYEAGFETTYGHTNTSLARLKKSYPKVVILRPKNYLEKGDTGNEVKNLQNYLIWMYGKKLTADGIFQDTTEAYVKMMQRSFGLKEDGIVGVQTLAKMKAYKK